MQEFYAWHDALLADLLDAASEPALARVRRYFVVLHERAAAASAEERGCLLALLALEKSATSEPIRAAVAQAFARWHARLGGLLEQARQGGELPADEDAAQLAGLLLHGWEGALLRARLDASLQPLSDFLELGLPRLLRA